MKTLTTVFSGTLILFAMTLQAQSIEPGEYKVQVDWDRISRGVETGDFSCHGTCAKVSIDWHQVWQTVSRKNYRDEKKADLKWCIEKYTAAKNAEDEIIADGGKNYSAEGAQLMFEIQETAVKSAETSCGMFIGAKAAKHLKEQIFGL